MHPSAPTKYLRQIEYLHKMGAPSFSDTDTVYFGCGRLSLPTCWNSWKKRKNSCFEYFIVEEGKMTDSILQVLKRKVSCGVEVRLLYDDLGSLTHVGRTFYRKLQNEGIRCAKFATIRPVASAVYNNRDHRKIAVIDGKVGYIGGINLADEYINEKNCTATGRTAP